MNVAKTIRYMPDFASWKHENLISLAHDLLLKVWELEDRLAELDEQLETALYRGAME